jgi:predicted metal-dependent phosphotriesterase family hydrolase
MRKRIAILLPAVVLMGGCALVDLTDAGAGVRLAKPEAVAACTNLGRVTASVVHKAGFIPRHPDAVQDNLNVTARNSAAGMGADTVVPASAIQDGKQTFDVYRCARR